MASRSYEQKNAPRKPDLFSDVSESGKRAKAYSLLRQKSDILQALLKQEQGGNKLDAYELAKKKRLIEIIETQLAIYINKRGNNVKMINLCQKLLCENRGR